MELALQGGRVDAGGQGGGVLEDGGVVANEQAFGQPGVCEQEREQEEDLEECGGGGRRRI